MSKKDILKQNLGLITTVATVLLGLGALWMFEFFGWAAWGPGNWHGRNITGTVTEKVIKGNRFFIYCKLDDSQKVEVLTIEDSTYFMNWDSGDDFANILPQTHYRFRVVGYRAPMFSRYRNIIDYKPMTEVPDRR